MKHPNAEQLLAPCSEFTEWVEWSQQSFLLFQQWWREVFRTGLRKSPTGTWFATTPKAVQGLCDQLALESLKDNDLVVEIGPGPGPMTQAILRRTRKNIRYLAIELNPLYAQRLSGTIDDPRLDVINNDANQISEIGQERRAQAKLVLSSMPFSRNLDLTRSILEQIRSSVLAPNGKLLVWNFMAPSMEQVEVVFGKENSKRSSVIPNLPPLRTVIATQPALSTSSNFTMTTGTTILSSTINPEPVQQEYPAPEPHQNQHSHP